MMLNNPSLKFKDTWKISLWEMFTEICPDISSGDEEDYGIHQGWVDRIEHLGSFSEGALIVPSMKPSLFLAFRNTIMARLHVAWLSSSKSWVTISWLVWSEGWMSRDHKNPLSLSNIFLMKFQSCWYWRKQNNEQFHARDLCSDTIKKIEGLIVKKTEGLIKRKNHNCPCLFYVLYNSYTWLI